MTELSDSIFVNVLSIVELAKFYTSDGKKVRMSDEHAARREKIRRAKLFKAAATRIQKNFKIYRLRKVNSIISIYYMLTYVI